MTLTCGAAATKSLLGVSGESDMKDQERPFGLFGDDVTNLGLTLGEMVQQSYKQAQCNMPEADRLMKDWLQKDSRFAGYDKDRLVAQVRECGHERFQVGSRRPLPCTGRTEETFTVGRENAQS